MPGRTRRHMLQRVSVCNRASRIQIWCTACLWSSGGSRSYEHLNLRDDLRRGRPACRPSHLEGCRSGSCLGDLVPPTAQKLHGARFSCIDFSFACGTATRNALVACRYPYDQRPCTINMGVCAFRKWSCPPNSFSAVNRDICAIPHSQPRLARL